MLKTCGIILAGGQGKRMKSNLPKPMLEVLGKPMIDWVLEACNSAELDEVCVVTGFANEILEKYLDGKCTTVWQKDRLGTGHAVMQCVDFLRKTACENTVILCGDAPFIDENTIKSALEHHISQNNSVTVISAMTENNSGYGRIVRENDKIKEIIEEKDCSDNEKAIKEINSGLFCFKTLHLVEALAELSPANAQGEYYLTDTVKIMLEKKMKAGAFTSLEDDFYIGANDRKGMAVLNEIAREKIIAKHLENGVAINFSDGVIIEKNVKIGSGTEILTGTILKGDTVIGENCQIGPNCLIENSTIGNDVKLNYVQSYESEIGNNVKIGPFVHIRPNSCIKDGVKIGDFVEIKNSTIDERTAVAHLTYIGDSDVGKKVNFGCGTVTVNYDGKNKARTTIKDNAFIGCNTNLIAPVTVGEKAYTAAGSTVTKDVPDGALYIERSQYRVVEGFSDRKLKK